MADEIKNADPSEEFNDDGEKNPDYKAPKDEVEGEENSETKNKEEGEEGDGKEKEESFDDTIDPENPPEIPVRKSVASHIIARKSRKIKKLTSKLKEGDEGYVPPTEAEEEEEEDTNLTPEATEAIDTKVKEVLNPILGAMATDADEKEMQDLLASEPEAKKYVNHIKAYMKHEQYQGVSPVVIYHHLAWTASEALGAKKKATADLEADQTKDGGRAIVDAGDVGDLPTAKQIDDMSDEDFDKMEEDALQGKFLKK